MVYTHWVQLAETAEQARQLAVEQTQVLLALRVSPAGQEVHVKAVPEQVGQLMSHGRQVPAPLTKYPAEHWVQAVAPLTISH